MFMHNKACRQRHTKMYIKHVKEPYGGLARWRPHCSQCRQDLALEIQNALMFHQNNWLDRNLHYQSKSNKLSSIENLEAQSFLLPYRWHPLTPWTLSLCDLHLGYLPYTMIPKDTSTITSRQKHNGQTRGNKVFFYGTTNTKSVKIPCALHH